MPPDRRPETLIGPGNNRSAQSGLGPHPEPLEWCLECGVTLDTFPLDGEITDPRQLGINEGICQDCLADLELRRDDVANWI